jgi:hypothetical protein
LIGYSAAEFEPQRGGAANTLRKRKSRMRKRMKSKSTIKIRMATDTGCDSSRSFSCSYSSS